MPAEVSVSELAQFLQAETLKVATEHSRDAIKTGLQRLPGGIMDGKAKLVEIGFFKIKEDSKAKTYHGQSAVGRLYFRAAGVCVFPEYLPQPDGQSAKCKGIQTAEIWPFYDSKRGGKCFTQAESVVMMMNCMKALVNNKDLFPEKIDNIAILHAVALTIKEKHIGAGKKPLYFRFSTSQSEKSAAYPNPRVFENWRGSEGLENWQPPSPLAAVQEDTPPPSDPTPDQLGDDTHHDTGTTSNGVDLVALVAECNGPKDDPKTAQATNRIAQLAMEAGWTADDVRGAADWNAVAGMIRNPKNAPPAPVVNGQPPSASNGMPKVTEVWRYTKAPALDRERKPIAGKFRSVDAQVTSLNTDGTIEMLNFDDQKTVYSKVPLADLEPV